MVSPYDWNEAIQHRAEYVEERLRDGSPVVGMRYAGGVLLLSLRRTQRKVFEVYDRIMMSAIGNQADVEAVRIASLDFAHQEGFSRSPDDVTVNRLVGFAVSPPLKKAFGDTWSSPLVFRGVFAELGIRGEDDRFATLNYDGDFAYSTGFAAAGGTRAAQDIMLERLGSVAADLPLEDAVNAALDVWVAGHQAATQSTSAPEVDDDEDQEEAKVLTTPEYLAALPTPMVIEAAVLERDRPSDSKFRLLSEQELKASPGSGE